MDLGNIGKQLESIFNTAGKNLTPAQRAELNRAQQQVKGLFKGQDLNNIENVDISKLTRVQESLTKTLENLKNGSVSDNK